MLGLCLVWQVLGLCLYFNMSRRTAAGVEAVLALPLGAAKEDALRRREEPTKRVEIFAKIVEEVVEENGSSNSTDEPDEDECDSNMIVPHDSEHFGPNKRRGAGVRDSGTEGSSGREARSVILELVMVQIEVVHPF